MKQLILAVLVSLGITGFAQETVIKEKTKTKLGHHRYERKVVKVVEGNSVAAPASASTAYSNNELSSHAAYRSVHARPVRLHHTTVRGVHRSSHAAYASSHRVHHRIVHPKRHYKEMKMKVHKGEYKVKYKY